MNYVIHTHRTAIHLSLTTRMVALPGEKLTRSENKQCDTGGISRGIMRFYIIALAVKTAPEGASGHEVRLRGLPRPCPTVYLMASGSLEPAAAGFVAERSEVVQARF